MRMELLSSYFFLYNREHDYAWWITTGLIMHQKDTTFIYKLDTMEYKLGMVSCIFTANYPCIILCNQKGVWLLKSWQFKCTLVFAAPYLCNQHLQEAPEVHKKISYNISTQNHMYHYVIIWNKMHSWNPEILTLRQTVGAMNCISEIEK